MSEKSIGQIAFDAMKEPDDPKWEDFPSVDRHTMNDLVLAGLQHAASLLRKMGEDEPTYQRQQCFERAAAMLEGLK